MCIAAFGVHTQLTKRRNNLGRCNNAKVNILGEKKDFDWTLRVLQDLKAFYDKNEMYDSADAVSATLAIIRAEGLSVQTEVSIRPSPSYLQ